MRRETLSAGLTLMMAALLVTPAAAGEDARKVKPEEPALAVIEEKCLVCHNRRRIDAALKERKDMEKVLRRMEKKGVVLTEAERRVMGHFQYEKPLKGKKGEARPQDFAK